MDRMTSMEVFVRVVDRGGFTAAAEGLGLSTTMVSNHIRSLEKRLGARLLNRTTRRQSLTEIGSAYYAKCVDILARLEAADLDARELQSRPRGRLRISAPTTFGSYLLVPALAEYLREYPDVQIELILNDRIVDLIDEGFDLAVRFGKLPDSGLVARRLKSLKRVICAAPGYLNQHGTPKVRSDLTTHNCLAFHYITAEREWHFDSSPAKSVAISGQLTINSGPALLMAALQSIGIVMIPDYLAKANMDAGSLVPLLVDVALPTASLHIVHMPDQHMTPKLKTLIDFLLKRFA